MTTGHALAMRLKLKRLKLEHHVATEPSMIPLTAPTTTAMVLEGYAATIDLDLDRTKLRRYAFGFPLPRGCRDVPLLFKHCADQPAGRIDDLDYDDEGNLVVRATVTHELARRCGAFSIAATVNEYEIKNPEASDFFAVISSATLTEISLTDTPSNPNARVMFRYQVSPQVQFYEGMSARVAKLVQLTKLIRRETQTCP